MMFNVYLKKKCSTIIQLSNEQKNLKLLGKGSYLVFIYNERNSNLFMNPMWAFISKIYIHTDIYNTFFLLYIFLIHSCVEMFRKTAI